VLLVEVVVGKASLTAIAEVVMTAVSVKCFIVYYCYIITGRMIQCKANAM
jgi:hypothetical protein